jgi:hypothetical protein
MAIETDEVLVAGAGSALRQLEVLLDGTNGADVGGCGDRTTKERLRYTGLTSVVYDLSGMLKPARWLVEGWYMRTCRVRSTRVGHGRYGASP